MRLGEKPQSAFVNGVAGLLVALLTAVLIGQQPMHLGFQTSGDTRLAERVRTILGADSMNRSTAGYRSLAVMSVSSERTRWAGLGNRGDGMAPTDTTMYEIGSITKLFTGLLLADAVDRGEVDLQDTLDIYLPSLKDTQSGGATLEELATHRSGLPAYADEVASQGYEGMGNVIVETITQDDVVEQAAGLSITQRGTYSYSNLGFALLGFALAEASGAPSWTGLVTQRVLQPAGMTHTFFVPSASNVPDSAAVGSLGNGETAPYLLGPSYYPAGTATFSTLDDLASFSRWVIDGNAIGLLAMTPRYPISATDEIGLGWVISTASKNVVVWHDGSVPGFSTVMMIDLTRKRASIVLGNSDAPVGQLGAQLLEPGTLMENSALPSVWVALATVGYAALVWGVYLVAGLKKRYLGLLAVCIAQAALVGAVAVVSWHNFPPWGWVFTSGAVLSAAIIGADRGCRSGRQLCLAVVAGGLAAVAFLALSIWMVG